MPREIEPAPLVLIEGANPFQLRDLVDRERARKAMIPRSMVQEVRPGVWGVYVVQLRPIRQRWIKPTVIGAGVLGALGGVAVAGWFLTSVVAAIGTGMVLTVAALAWLGYAGLTARPGSGCETTVTIRHRH